MANTLLSQQDLRDRFDLYLNDAEREQIRASANAARLPMSTFVRRAALRQRVATPPSDVNASRWSELARTTANLNQLAHAINSGKATGVEPAVIHALAEQVRLLRLELIGVAPDATQ